MKTLTLKNKIAALIMITTLAFTSCKKNTVEHDENAPPVVTTEGDTVHVDTSQVPLDTGKATKPVIRTNAEDGTNSAL